MRPGSRLRRIGWAVVLSVCMAGFVALTFRVNAVKSEVRLAEREIIALQREKIVLETEFETRANQQQLADWNRIEFGYQAPRADQYLENERELASLGLPRGLDAPDPIRVARAPVEPQESGFPQLVSSLSGGPVADTDVDAASDKDRTRSDMREERSAPTSLADRLALGNPLGRQLIEAPE